MAHFIKTVILFVMGLAGMYMIHLLAQDYNRVRQPLEMATRFFSLASNQFHLRDKRSNNLQLQRLHYEQQQQILNDTLASIDWERILSRDPFNCLQSLICQLMSEADGNTNMPDASSFINFIKLTLPFAPPKIKRAFSRGLAIDGRTERCYEEFYPLCIYSARTMLHILTWFSDRNE